MSHEKTRDGIEPVSEPLPAISYSLRTVTRREKMKRERRKKILNIIFFLANSTHV